MSDGRTARGDETVLGRAISIAPILEENRGEGERQARLSSKSFHALRGAGLFGLWAPAEVGGEEATLREGFDAIVVIAEADPSAAWYVMNSTACATAAGLVDRSYWPTVYEPPLANSGLSAAVGGTLKVVERGYVLTGSWPMMTGVLDASWAVVNARLKTASGEPIVRSAVVPTASLAVEETWQNASAMRGTGSHKVSAEGVYVPEGLVVDLAAKSQIDRPLYRCGHIVRSAAINAGIPIGIMRSAVSSMADELRGKVSSIFGVKAAQSTALLEMMADSVAALTHLEAGTALTIDRIWSYVERDAEPPIALRGAIVGEMFRAVDVAREHISHLYGRSSRAAFLAGHPLERALRDIHAVAYGLDTLRPLQHAAGRVALGLDPGIPL